MRASPIAKVVLGLSLPFPGAPSAVMPGAPVRYGWKADIENSVRERNPVMMKMPPASGASIDVQGCLETAILRCDGMDALCTLIDKLAMLAAPSAKLDAHLRKFIDQPVPYLTARVFRMYRYTGSSDLSLHEAASSYLTLNSYDGDWYDETINSIGWANELLADQKQSPLVPAYQQFLTDADQQNHKELLEFCQGYSL